MGYMKIKDGGIFGSTTLKSIQINKTSNYMFDLWLNETSVSHLTINEMLKLKDIIQKEIINSIKRGNNND